MKSTRLFHWLILISIIFSCQSDHYEIDQDSSEINTNLAAEVDYKLKNLDPKVLYPNLLLPNELVQKYLSDDFAEEDYNAIKDWLADKTAKLEKECKKSTECGEKMTYVDKLLFIQKQMDILGMDEVEVIHGLCDGFFDEENTFVNIIPDHVKLEVDQSIDLDFEIMVGESKCLGDVEWGSDNPGIATVNQEGLVSAVSSGVTLIRAYVIGTNHIYGLAQIEVVETIDKFEIVLVLETGSGTYDITGFNTKYENGVKQSGEEIYAALSRNFEENFKFGLVGFEHYPVSPWGSSASSCRAGGWDYPEFEPLISMSPFEKWLSLTDNETSIKNAIAGIQLMCSYHDWPANWNSAPFSAVIKTIENFNWSEDTNKIIILFGKYPATYRPTQAGGNVNIEGYSGYTLNDVITSATANDIQIFTMCNIPDRDTSLYNTSKYEYESIATRTNGQYTNDVWPVANSLTTVIDNIKASY